MANVVEVIIRAHDRTRDAFQGVASSARSLFSGIMSGIAQLSSRMISNLGDAGRRGIQRFREHFNRDGSSGLFRGMTRGIRDFMGNMLETVKGGLSRVGGMFQDAFSGGFRSALSTPAVGPIIIGAVAAVAATIGPIIAALIASAITLGLGAALVGVGAMIVMKNKDVKEKLGKDFKDVGKTMEHAFKPLIPVIEHVGDVAKKVAKTFDPVINKAMKLAEPHLKKFVDELGKSFEALAPAVGPLMDAFTKILDELGPELPGMITKISNSLIEMFEAVGEHPEVITETFAILVDIIVGTIKVIGWLTDAVGEVEREWGLIKHSFSETGKVLSNLGGWFAGLWAGIVSGASDAWGWITRVAGSIKRLVGKVVHIGQSGASGVIHWVSSAIGTIRRFVGKIVRIGQSGAQGAISIVSRLIATIRRFVGKIVRIGVSGVEGAINAVSRLIGWIRNLVGKTVNVGVNIVGAGKSLLGFAHGGIVGAAGGGPRSSMVMVGEQGRELVRLPFGSTVIPHGQTESMMASGEGAVARVELEWVGTNGSDKLFEWLKENIRLRVGGGSNSVQKALGQ